MNAIASPTRPEGADRLRPETPPPTAGSMDNRQKHDAAAYIASLLAGLRQIADGAQLEKLVSALDNAFYEAFTLTQAKQPQGEQPVRRSTEQG